MSDEYTECVYVEGLSALYLQVEYDDVFEVLLMFNYTLYIWTSRKLLGVALQKQIRFI
jgi:hypothetical protein